MPRGSHRKQSLSREELEINAAFSASEDDSDGQSRLSNGQRHMGGSSASASSFPQNQNQQVPTEQVTVLQAGSVDQLSSILAKSLMSALSSSPANNLSNREEQSAQIPSNNAQKRPHQNLPSPTGRPSDANNTLPIQFGVNVNPPPPGDEDRNGSGYADHQFPAENVIPDLPSIPVFIPDPIQVNAQNSQIAPVVAIAPDPSLPQADSEVPNWNPDPAVMAWAASTIDVMEWSAEDRKSLMKEFIPEKVYDHFFQAVNMPQQIQDAMKYKSII